MTSYNYIGARSNGSNGFQGYIYNLVYSSAMFDDEIFLYEVWQNGRPYYTPPLNICSYSEFLNGSDCESCGSCAPCTAAEQCGMCLDSGYFVWKEFYSDEWDYAVNYYDFFDVVFSSPEIIVNPTRG